MTSDSQSSVSKKNSKRLRRVIWKGQIYLLKDAIRESKTTVIYQTILQRLDRGYSFADAIVEGRKERSSSPNATYRQEQPDGPRAVAPKIVAKPIRLDSPIDDLIRSITGDGSYPYG